MSQSSFSSKYTNEKRQKNSYWIWLKFMLNFRSINSKIHSSEVGHFGSGKKKNLLHSVFLKIFCFTKNDNDPVSLTSLIILTYSFKHPIMHFTGLFISIFLSYFKKLKWLVVFLNQIYMLHSVHFSLDILSLIYTATAIEKRPAEKER